MAITDLKKPLKVLRPFRPPLHRQKIDDLNEQPRLAAARFTHDVDQLSQSRYESIVADAQQRTARNVAHSRRLDHQHRRTSLSKARVPIEVLLRDKPVLGRAPRHHRRHPRAARRLMPSDFYGTVEKGSSCFI